MWLSIDTFQILMSCAPFIVSACLYWMLSPTPANICWSSRHVLKTSSTRLQRNNFTSSKTSWRLFQDLSQDVLKTSWRRLGRRKIVALKTSSRRLEDMSWRGLEDMSWRRLEGISWRRLQDDVEENEMFIGDICI